jgi:PIN domain nuclease of toxin-antitoxin system
LKLLLDTHIWLWTFTQPARLGKRVFAELSNLDNELWLSPVSLWEALILERKKKIQVPAHLQDWWLGAAKRFTEAPLTREIVLVAHQLPLPPDPADRFLAATAKVLGLTLVTADDRLLGLGDIATLGNH